MSTEGKCDSPKKELLKEHRYSLFFVLTNEIVLANNLLQAYKSMVSPVWEITIAKLLGYGMVILGHLLE